MRPYQPPVGTVVRVLVPQRWERRGVVVATDYHPLGFEDAVQVQFEGETEWVSGRYVFPIQSTAR